MSLTKLSLEGNNLTIPGQGELVIDIAAGDGKIASLFYSVSVFYGSNCSIPPSQESWQRVLAIGFQLILSNIFYHPSVYPCIDWSLDIYITHFDTFLRKIRLDNANPRNKMCFFLLELEHLKNQKLAATLPPSSNPTHDPVHLRIYCAVYEKE